MRYELDTEEGMFVETSTAAKHWEEDTRWDGSNHISCATGSQWEHETLYLSVKGYYYVVHTSQWQGSRGFASRVSEAQAAAWLLRNAKAVPAALAQYAEMG